MQSYGNALTSTTARNQSTPNHRGPYKLIYYEAYGAETDARRRESMLKLRGQARKQLLLRLKDTLLYDGN